MSTFAPPVPTATQTNKATVYAAIESALTRLGQIQTQAATFQAQAAYATANLANLNDLLSKSQTMALAISDLAQDLRYLVRVLNNDFSGSS